MITPEERDALSGTLSDAFEAVSRVSAHMLNYGDGWTDAYRKDIETLVLLGKLAIREFPNDDDDSLDQKYYAALAEKDAMQAEIFALRAEIHRLKEQLQA